MIPLSPGLANVWVHSTVSFVTKVELQVILQFPFIFTVGISTQQFAVNLHPLNARYYM